MLLPERLDKTVDVEIMPVTFYSGSNGKIMNLTSDMEYSVDNGTS
jgi:hypothetical protein